MNIVPTLKTVFPKLTDEMLHDGMTLGEIPGWDSMNAVNLQIEIDVVFSVDISDIPLPKDMLVADLTREIEKRLA